MAREITADSIAEELLAITGRALLSGDFVKFSSCFEIPLQLATLDGTRTLSTPGEFRQVFDDVRSHMWDTEVVDFVRTVVSAVFIDDDTISSVHICSEINTGGILKRPAYPVRSTLRRFRKRWKIVSCFYFIVDSQNHNAALVKRSGSGGQAQVLH